MAVQNSGVEKKSDDSLFLGLQSYSEAQADIFYGRDEEIEKLTNLIKANTLTIVFGKSGTGKTSLLNAGVFPRLRKNYCLPFRIRLEFSADSPDLITQVKKILKTEIDKYGFKVDSYPGDETLWEYFHKESLWKSVTPILIFDQFEEIFTLAKKSVRFSGKELETFWVELSDLIENSIPEKLKDAFLNNKEGVGYNYRNQYSKILFTFREEYLPEFESVTSKIPSIKYSRFRLMPMNGRQAYDVITKTWKDKIDAADAEKIVGFFIQGDEKNTSYDVMEIEPSLLSQVCAFIDKERIQDGRDKISAEFLNKYPKEKILRSIYDEALAESNEEVKRAGNIIAGKARPVNEFIEEKLITDEGFRTKYSLNEIDNHIKPGIEVLIKKYFLRNDGKAIELTHDVLTPFIKEDREERRKENALAIEKIKARKRATKIITISLLFSIVAAGMIWYFTTKKAIKDKEIAETKTIELNKNILKDSITLDSVKNRIKDLVIDKNDTGNINKILKLQKINLEYDTTIGLLNNQVKQLTNELAAKTNVADSMKNEFQRKIDAVRKLKSDDSVALQNNMNDLNQKYTELKNTYAGLNTDYTNLKNESANYKNDNAALKTSYDNLKRDYDLLNKNYNELKKSNSPVNTPAPQPVTPVDNNKLILNLYSASSDGVPDNLVIYLVPDVSANKKIIRQASQFEKGCDNDLLKGAQGVKVANFDNDVYSFADVAPGDYFIKFCTYYGGYYMITKKATGNETTKRLNIAPPVK